MTWPRTVSDILIVPSSELLMSPISGTGVTYRILIVSSRCFSKHIDIYGIKAECQADNSQMNACTDTLQTCVRHIHL